MTKEEKESLLKERLVTLSQYEESLYRQGCSIIAGVDEVGRGPLAGPVVAAAVILPRGFAVLGVDDSKKLSPKRREELYHQIRENAIAFAIGMEDQATIDRINILEATKRAMKQALDHLNALYPIDHVLVDALTLKEVSLPQTAIIKGDAKSVSIAAASILAKVTRDRMMEDYHRQYPHYGFDQNKGYGTRTHYQGISTYGICPIHRLSFLGGIPIEPSEDEGLETQTRSMA